MNRPLRTAAGLLLTLLLSSPALVRSAAQNKLIVKHFRWKITGTEHFDIYHAPGSEKLVPPAAKLLEEAYPRVTAPLGVRLPKRAAFFLFMNHNKFEQNNVVDVGEGTGGVTEAFKDRFLVFNDGSQAWLEHVIAHEFVHVCQFQVLYAGFWRSARLLKSFLYPLWFMEGMAEYFSAGRDEPQKEMVLRDAVTSKTLIPLRLLHNFNHVKPHQVTLAYKTGCAAMEYISREYGEDKLGLLLKSLTEKFDMNGALRDVLGISLEGLDERFTEDLEEKYGADSRDLHEPSFYGEALTAQDPIYPVFNAQAALFPDGKSLAFVSDQDGFDEICRYDFPGRRAVSLKIQKRFSFQVEAIHRDGSALSVSPDGRYILFAGELKQKDHLYVYDIFRDGLKTLKFPLDGAKSPQFSPDGRRIGFIGMKGGYNDVYLCDLKGRGLRQLTDTEEDENDLRFYPDGGSVLFSREKLAVGQPGNMERDLWKLQIDPRAETRITSLAGNESQPAVSPDGMRILFVNDGTGRFELFQMTGGQEPVQLTRSIGGSFHPAFVPGGDRFVFTAFRAGQQQLYVSPAKATARAPAQAERLDHFEGYATAKSSSPLMTEPPRRYRLRASTDFFFPVFFYSSTDGLFLSAYWQASEMLGNHQIQAAVTYASAFDFLNYQILYSYLKFRPQVFFGFQGDTQENVFVSSRERRREDAQFAGVTYPLSRFDSVTTRFLTTQRRVQLADDDFVTTRGAGRENVAGLSFLRDITQGRYLETVSGYRVSAQAEESNRGFDSSFDYRNIFLDYQQFVPSPSEGALAFRAFGGAGFGEDRQLFRTGGADLLRGYGRFDAGNAAARFAIANLEYRFPIVLNANAHVWFIFPDFLFKSVYGHIFTDTGLLWNSGSDLSSRQMRDLKHSVGAGLRFQAFVLQTFPISIQLDFARRTLDGEQVFYLGFGPHF